MLPTQAPPVPGAPPPTAEQQYQAMATYQAAMEEYMKLQAAQAAQVAQYQAMAQAGLAYQAYPAIGGLQAAQVAAAYAAPVAATEAAPLAGQDIKPKQYKSDDRELITGIITKVDEGGDFGFVKCKEQTSHVFIHKMHYSSSRDDQDLEVGALIQFKIFLNNSGKQSASQAQEIVDPELQQQFKKEMNCDILDGTTYTDGWIVWMDHGRQHGKIRSEQLENLHWGTAQVKSKKGASISKQKTIGLTTGMKVSFQVELNEKDELLGRNVFVVPGSMSEDCPFPIDDGTPKQSGGGKAGGGKDKGKGKGKDDKGKGKGKGDAKGKGKGKIIPPPSFMGGGGGASSSTWGGGEDGGARDRSRSPMGGSSWEGAGSSEWNW